MKTPSSNQSKMEEVLVRFHQVGKRIFEELDNKSLTKCREVNKSWRGFIDGEKTVPFRIIKSLTNVHESYLDKNFGKVDLDSVKELVKNVQHVYGEFNKFERNFEIKASKRCNREFIISLQKDGHIMATIMAPLDLDECQLAELDTGKLFLSPGAWGIMVSESNAINPKVFGTTALHLAAEEGYLNVCKLIAENVHENNPKIWGEEWGVEGTPLQVAEKNGHPSVVKYFQSLMNVVEEPRKKKRKQK